MLVNQRTFEELVNKIDFIEYEDVGGICGDINDHFEYRARRQTILDKMKQLHHLFFN